MKIPRYTILLALAQLETTLMKLCKLVEEYEDNSPEFMAQWEGLKAAVTPALGKWVSLRP